MNLVIDVGNTRTKIGIFAGDKLIEQVGFAELTPDSLSQVCAKYPELKSAILSAVKGYSQKIVADLERLKIKFIELDHETPLPIANLYKTPKTLGKDRLAAAIGANKKYPNQNVLIVDAGTAITFDLVTAKNEFFGGNISLGLDMRFKALNHFTGKLPLLEKHSDYPFIGQTTEEAMQAGVQNSVRFEIVSYYQELQRDYSGLKLILTGGDATYLSHFLEVPFVVEQNLTLEGLNYLLNFNNN